MCSSDLFQNHAFRAAADNPRIAHAHRLLNVVIRPESIRQKIPDQNDHNRDHQRQVMPHGFRVDREPGRNDRRAEPQDRRLDRQEKQVTDPQPNQADQDELNELLRQRLFPGIRVRPEMVPKKIQ